MIMASLSNLRARVSNRLARHLFAAPMQLKSGQPMVSFTFDDIPMSAATVGAPMLEEFGGRGTFYVAGGLVNRRTDQGDGIDPDGIMKLRRSGHEIACHTFSHQRAIDLDATAMAAEIEQNRRFLEGLDASIKLENFAYPYGLATVARKRQLTNSFRSARGILPGVNSGTIDLQFLRSTPLIDKDIDRAGIDRVFDEAVATNGWLIFYTHDVADTPSPWGCTPGLLRHALDAAKRRNMPMVSVAEALAQSRRLSRFRRRADIAHEQDQAGLAVAQREHERLVDDHLDVIVGRERSRRHHGGRGSRLGALLRQPQFQLLHHAADDEVLVGELLQRVLALTRGPQTHGIQRPQQLFHRRQRQFRHADFAVPRLKALAAEPARDRRKIRRRSRARIWSSPPPA